MPDTEKTILLSKKTDVPKLTLSNENTFLTYMRTSMSAVVAGK